MTSSGTEAKPEISGPIVGPMNREGRATASPSAAVDR
jgi:hypothetical protein